MSRLNFIKENISGTNARRLLVTDPEIQRDEVIFQHTKRLQNQLFLSRHHCIQVLI